MWPMVRVAGVGVRCAAALVGIALGAAVAVLAVLAVTVCPAETLARPHARPHARNARHRRHAPRLKPAAPLPVLPTLSRVELAVERAFVVVTETLQLTRNDWEKGELRVCIGHGAPGAPKAFDARLHAPVADVGPAPLAPGQALPSEFAPSCPVNARLVLGGANMATSVVTISEPAIRTAFDKSDRAMLRIRFLLEAPQKEADGGRELLLRLGAPEDVPIALSSMAIRSSAENLDVTRVEAMLCGPQADAIALTVEGSQSALPTLNPALTIRRAGDDLCVRYWTNAR